MLGAFGGMLPFSFMPWDRPRFPQCSVGPLFLAEMEIALRFGLLCVLLPFFFLLSGELLISEKGRSPSFV